MQVPGWRPPVWPGCAAVLALAPELVLLLVQGSVLMWVPELAPVLALEARPLLGLARSALLGLGLLQAGLLQAGVAWRCCWPPAPAALSLQELWPQPVPAEMLGSAPCPSSCQPPAQRRGSHPVAPVGPVATAASVWRAVRGCPGSVATAQAGWCWVPEQGWRPWAVLVMLQGQVLGWGRAVRLRELRR